MYQTKNLACGICRWSVVKNKRTVDYFYENITSRCLTGSFEYTSEADKALTHKN